ncbi:hypothetical protein ACFWIJ_04020 [Streptomyces sp. NPDC127079]|uniref:hypothetical protein n=1 Tax=Streptomyces sp. NPDC127079 TaxID=3347132 RepID=UPI0036620F1D
MSFEDALLAAHLLAVLTLLVSLITDWFGVHMLRDATTAPQAREGRPRSARACDRARLPGPAWW